MENNVISSGRDLMSDMFKIPLSSISEERLIQETVDLMLVEGILNRPIRFKDGNAYYFNKAGRYCMDKDSSQFEHLKGKGCFVSFYLWPNDGSTFWCPNRNLWRHAVASFPVGATLEECAKIFLDSKIVRRNNEYSYLERLVGRIEKPLFEREPENENKNTFDRIRVSVCLTKSMFNSWDELKTAVKAYRIEIAQMALDKIEENNAFQRFGVPINVIKPTDITLRRDCTLEYIFEPKIRELSGPDPQSDFDHVIQNAKQRAGAQSAEPQSQQIAGQGR